MSVGNHNTLSASLTHNRNQTLAEAATHTYKAGRLKAGMNGNIQLQAADTSSVMLNKVSWSNCMNMY